MSGTDSPEASPPRRGGWWSLVLAVAVVGLASQWWGERGQRSLGERVAVAAAPGDLRMLSSQFCGSCTMARAWFTEFKVPFEECLIERDAQCRAEFERLGGPGTPVIVVRGQPQLGFSPPRLAAALGIDA